MSDNTSVRLNDGGASASQAVDANQETKVQDDQRVEREKGFVEAEQRTVAEHARVHVYDAEWGDRLPPIPYEPRAPHEPKGQR